MLLKSTMYGNVTLSPSYRPVPPSRAPPLTALKRLPRFPLLPPSTGCWPPANTMCQERSTYCAHKMTLTLHTMTLSTMFTNNFCACQSFRFTNIQLICSVLVEFKTSFFQVLTCFNGCMAMDARLGFGTRLRWFCDRGVW